MCPFYNELASGEIAAGGRTLPRGPSRFRTSDKPMQRFKIGNAVHILPKFAHLYADKTGVIVRIEIDPFRSTFNEYTIEFPNGSTAHLFEFQILEDGNHGTIP